MPGENGTFEFYEGAGHAFFAEHDRLGTYDEGHAKNAWNKTLDFFRRHLQEPARRAEHSGIEDRFETSRLEAFSDGVFAIAITLLVPTSRSRSVRRRAIGEQWPDYIGYVSFLTIGGLRLIHHAVMRGCATPTT